MLFISISLYQNRIASTTGYDYFSPMTRFLAIVFILVSFASCEKIEPSKKWEVHYQLLNIGNDIPTYRVNYTLKNGSTKKVGPFNTYNWESEALTEFEEGTSVFLEIEIISGKGQFEMIILRDGAIHEKETMPLNVSNYRIESEI